MYKREQVEAVAKKKIPYLQGPTLNECRLEHKQG